MLAFSTLPGLASANLMAQDYFPLAEGNFWQYVEAGNVTSTDTVLLGTVNIGGIDTLVLETVGGDGDADINNLTNDLNGLRIHRVGEPGFSLTFSPPVILLNADFALGVPVNSQGNVTVTGIGTLGYTATSTPSGPVPVTVPFGTFDAVLLDTTLTVDGVTETDRVWLAEGIGPVKYIYDVFGEAITRDLVATNVPEPAISYLLALGLAGLVARSVRYQ